ncbi:MAG: hypothetical protein ACOYB3_01045 [Azonexus sp.]
MATASDIHHKAAFYGVALFFTPFADKIVPILFLDRWPSAPMVVGCSLLGIIAMSIGLRAYYDGSYERAKGLDNRVIPLTDAPKPVVPAKTP